MIQTNQLLSRYKFLVTSRLTLITASELIRSDFIDVFLSDYICDYWSLFPPPLIVDWRHTSTLSGNSHLPRDQLC